MLNTGPRQWDHRVLTIRPPQNSLNVRFNQGEDSYNGLSYGVKSPMIDELLRRIMEKEWIHFSLLLEAFWIKIIIYTTI